MGTWYHSMFYFEVDERRDGGRIGKKKMDMGNMDL
jgi:hypothetical protein